MGKVNPVFLQTPKLKELKTQCASCPFRHGNDVEFGAIVKKVCKLHKTKFSKFQVVFARGQIEIECESRIDFACHNTTYNDDMTDRDRKEHRQCPGASEFYRRNNSK